MKLSNRILWILILLSMIGGFYIFYQIFFKIKLTHLEISSNIEDFSGSLENTKFSKNFYCEKKNCIIDKIPPFEYKLKINKKNYKIFTKNIDLRKTNTIKIILQKNIVFEKIKNNQISKLQQIKNSLKDKIIFQWKKINYKKIYNSSDFVYFIKDEKIYFYDLETKNSFSIKLKPKVNYIKKIDNNKLAINTKVWTFVLNILNKKLDYFSLFWDFVFAWNNSYIWIVNNLDKIRKKNFDFENISWNLILFYNKITKKKYIIKTFENKIEKIYFENNKLFVENNLKEKFEIKNF